MSCEVTFTMPSPLESKHQKKAGLGGSGSEKSIAVPPAPPPCARNLILTILLSTSPLICALWYQSYKENKAQHDIKVYEQLLEQLNNKENLTKQEVQIKEDIEEKLEEKPPNNNTNNNVKPNFGKKPWHRGGSNSRRKTR